MLNTVLILFSAILFSLSTVFAKLATNTSDIPASQITFVRFLTGFIISAFIIVYQKTDITPKKTFLVVWRAIFNTIAVILFFVGIKFTTITNANMLNMTYPVFVVLMAPIINREKIKKSVILYMVLTILSMYLIVRPHFAGIGFGDTISLVSAVFSAFAISMLKESRKFDKSSVILLYHMGIGAILSFFVAIFFWENCSFLEWIYIFLSALAGTIGQFTLTSGIKEKDATVSSILSSSRVMWSLFFGVLIFSDPINLMIVIGSILLMVVLIGVSGGFEYFKKKLL